MDKFKLASPFKPTGDQPQAIKELNQGLLSAKKYQTLMGATGTGKTFTISNVIASVNKPTLVISHNKTLAAQLYSEFKEFFPHNAVEYFVSYYDYYQPEAYIPVTDTYIEKDASINENLDRLRLSATSSLMSRNDVIIVASVSCIYNLGSPQDYKDLLLFLEKGKEKKIDEALSGLVAIHYERNDYDFKRGKFRVRGDILDIFPAYATSALRIEFFGNKIDKITEINPITGDAVSELDKIAVYPAKHFVTTPETVVRAIKSIETELKEHLEFLRSKNKLLEAQRLETRTKYDMEMMREIGYCAGVENYSRHLSWRPPGSRPYCLIDYFPDDFLTIIDESHVTLPQLRGMYNGDRSRKETLVEFGFRMPSCLDNRPLKFDELEGLLKQLIYVSATPNEYEISRSGEVVEQIIRPTGIVDPAISVHPTKGQIDDLIAKIKERARKKERVLVTTLTKRLAEDLSGYLSEMDLSVKYLHSEIEPIERVKILKELRMGAFDCLVGVNLLREGLDLPEVSLVAVLDADKEGFLRSATSLIQVAGRTARNINGQVVLYADTITGSMKKAIDETRRRQKIQLEYNKVNKIIPKTIEKAIREGIEVYHKARELTAEVTGLDFDRYEVNLVVSELEEAMELAARNLQFERAAALRDQIANLKKKHG
ncbi:MAG: excinuclease ABC subunit UvrB [Candidatus Omnitrophota bacterium]